MSVLGLSLGILTLLGVVISNSVIVGLPSGFVFAGVAFLGLIIASADKNSKGLRAAAQVVCIVSIGVNGVIGYSFYDTVKAYQERNTIIDETQKQKEQSDYDYYKSTDEFIEFAQLDLQRENVTYFVSRIDDLHQLSFTVKEDDTGKGIILVDTCRDLGMYCMEDNGFSDNLCTLMDIEHLKVRPLYKQNGKSNIIIMVGSYQYEVENIPNLKQVYDYIDFLIDSYTEKYGGFTDAELIQKQELYDGKWYPLER